jgi:hypothetical protein
MSYELDAAARYRSHAEELRTIAEDDRLVQTRDMLLRVAWDYDRMARNLEELDDSFRRLKPPSNAAGSTR